MENSKKDIQSVIAFLNKLNFRILEIEGSYYSISLFEEANQNNWKHTVEGKLIDDVITSFVNINKNDTSQEHIVITKIQECPVVHKYFHKDCKFIYHLK
jgi:hypothetical protein